MSSKVNLLGLTRTQLQAFFQDLGEKDHEEIKNRVMEVLRNSLKPEFLNRIDEIVIFNNLDRENIKKIADIQMKHLKARLTEKKMDIELTGAAKEMLCERGYDPTYGARPLKRAIQKYIQDPLALKILEGEFSEGDTIVVDVDKVQKEFLFNHRKKSEAA